MAHGSTAVLAMFAAEGFEYSHCGHAHTATRIAAYAMACGVGLHWFFSYVHEHPPKGANGHHWGFYAMAVLSLCAVLIGVVSAIIALPLTESDECVISFKDPHALPRTTYYFLITLALLYILASTVSLAQRFCASPHSAPDDESADHDMEDGAAFGSRSRLARPQKASDRVHELLMNT